MAKCVICERRPERENGRCASCASTIAAERNAKASREPKHFLTYKGHVVGLFPNGSGKLIARLLGRSPDNLPKHKTINLNVYCEGYTREQIKSFKACVLRLANA